MEYFFIIKYAGLDKNGNIRYKVTGCHKIGSKIYVTLNKEWMQDFIGGRWSNKTESITTQQNLEQIKEKLEKLPEYSYVVL